LTPRRGLMMVAAGALLLGLLGVLARGAAIPASLLLVLRMSIGGVPIAAVSDTLLEGASPAGALAECRRPLASSSLSLCVGDGPRQAEEAGPQ